MAEAARTRRGAAPRQHARKGAGHVRVLPTTPRADGAADLDGILHHRLRLGIVSALAAADVLTFVELRELLSTTDGNMSVHARKLEEAGLVSCVKSFAGRRPRTDYRLTAAGQRALRRYLAHMEALIASARTALER